MKPSLDHLPAACHDNKVLKHSKLSRKGNVEAVEGGSRDASQRGGFKLRPEGFKGAHSSFTFTYKLVIYSSVLL